MIMRNQSTQQSDNDKSDFKSHLTKDNDKSNFKSYKWKENKKLSSPHNILCSQISNSFFTVRMFSWVNLQDLIDY